MVHINVTDIYTCLKVFLHRSDNLRWLTIGILYSLLPHLSAEQKSQILLVQTDTEHLIRSLRTADSFHSTLQLIAHAISLLQNMKVLHAGGVLEVLAEMLDDENISQCDQNDIALLIEKMVTADVHEEQINSLSVTEENLQEAVSSFTQYLQGNQKFFLCAHYLSI